MSDSSNYDKRSVSPWSSDDPIQKLKERIEKMEKCYREMKRCLQKAKDDNEELEDNVNQLKIQMTVKHHQRKEK